MMPQLTGYHVGVTNLNRYLGATAIRLPAIGQGTTQTGSYAARTQERDQERISVLRLGIELGMTLIDTAELYGGGHAEELVGRAIKGIRDKVFLASKFRPDHGTFEGIMRAIDDRPSAVTDRIPGSLSDALAQSLHPA